MLAFWKKQLKGYNSLCRALILSLFNAYLACLTLFLGSDHAMLRVIDQYTQARTVSLQYNSMQGSVP